VAALSWIAFAFQPLLGGALVAALATGTGLWLCTSEERR
jgi:hypothetical protein